MVTVPVTAFSIAAGIAKRLPTRLRPRCLGAACGTGGLHGQNLLLARRFTQARVQRALLYQTRPGKMLEQLRVMLDARANQRRTRIFGSCASRQ